MAQRFTSAACAAGDWTSCSVAAPTGSSSSCCTATCRATPCSTCTARPISGYTGTLASTICPAWARKQVGPGQLLVRHLTVPNDCIRRQGQAAGGQGPHQQHQICLEEWQLPAQAAKAWPSSDMTCSHSHSTACCILSQTLWPFLMTTLTSSSSSSPSPASPQAPCLSARTLDWRGRAASRSSQSCPSRPAQRVHAYPRRCTCRIMGCITCSITWQHHRVIDMQLYMQRHICSTAGCRQDRRQRGVQPAPGFPGRPGAAAWLQPSAGAARWSPSASCCAQHSLSTCHTRMLVRLIAPCKLPEHAVSQGTMSCRACPLQAGHPCVC